MNLHGFEATAAERPDPAAARRFFTVEQANATIPLVSRIVRDIVAQYETVMREQARMAQPLPPEQRGAAESARQEAKVRLLALARELEDIGCELKDWAVGLVDFPAKLDGREVCLCWKLGEPAVEYWHDPDAGFPGRKPIADKS